MEGLSADWQSLLRIQPNDIDADNDEQDDDNERLGAKYMKVKEKEVICKYLMNIFL